MFANEWICLWLEWYSRVEWTEGFSRMNFLPSLLAGAFRDCRLHFVCCILVLPLACVSFDLWSHQQFWAVDFWKWQGVVFLYYLAHYSISLILSSIFLYQVFSRVQFQAFPTVPVEFSASFLLFESCGRYGSERNCFACSSEVSGKSDSVLEGGRYTSWSNVPHDFLEGRMKVNGLLPEGTE